MFPVIYLLTTSTLFFFSLKSGYIAGGIIPSLAMKLCGLHTAVVNTEIMSYFHNLRRVCSSLGTVYTERVFLCEFVILIAYV